MVLSLFHPSEPVLPATAKAGEEADPFSLSFRKSDVDTGRFSLDALVLWPFTDNIDMPTARSRVTTARQHRAAKEAQPDRTLLEELWSHPQ